MIKITKKDFRVLKLLNDFGYLDEEFFIILFHSSSKLQSSVIAYKVRIYLCKLMKAKLVCVKWSNSGSRLYSLTPGGRAFLLNAGVRTFPNKLVIDNGKFAHARLCSKVYAKIASSFEVQFRSENELVRLSKTSIVPDLAIKQGTSVIYFEIERSLKSEVLIKEKLANYNKNFKSGHLIYLTEHDSIIKKIMSLRINFSNKEKIHAYDLVEFMKDPTFYLKEAGTNLSRGICQ